MFWCQSRDKSVWMTACGALISSPAAVMPCKSILCRSEALVSPTPQADLHQPERVLPAAFADTKASATAMLPEDVLVVLGALEHLSGERDQERLQTSMMQILADTSGAAQAVLYIDVEDRFDPVLAVQHEAVPRQIDPDLDLPHDPMIIAGARQRLAERRPGGNSILLSDTEVAYALYGPKGLAAMVILRYPSPTAMRPWWIGSFLTIYQNHVNLINDAERDTLTGLFNRKTFDGRFNRLLAMQRAARESSLGVCSERRAIRPGEHHWLAVVDIDHFKNVNDRFGHLYGDEVLILLSRLMMRGFRMEDRLFRFGGEEFVIVLSPCNAAGAAMVLERFRTTIEKFEFPQVGRVTASLGYTRVRLDDMPSVAVGRADAALYYAKRNGRNRVCSFDHLAAAGAIKVAGALASDVTIF